MLRVYRWMAIHNFRLWHASLRHPAGNISLPDGIMTYVYMCFVFHIGIFSRPAACLFSCPRLRGTEGARTNTTAQVWALAKVRGTCSGG